VLSDQSTMSRSLIPVIAFVVVAATVGHAAIGGVAAQNGEVTLTITVVDSDGNTVSGIDLSVTWDGGDGGPRNATTRANGQALVDVPEGSDVEITIDDDRYVRNRPFTLSDASTERVEVPISRSGTATITVRQASGPVADAQVSLRDDTDWVGTYRTDDDGVITTDRLEKGEYRVFTRKSRYLINRTSITVPGDGEATSTVLLRRGTVEARFVVTDDHFEDPRPVENATIEIAGVGTTLSTLPDGTRSTDLPVNRDYEITVTKGGYGSEVRTLEVGQEPVTFEASIQRTPGLNIRAANSRVVVGESTTVTVANEYDERVSGATVSVAGESAGETDSQGQVTVPIESEGNVTIEATDGDNSASVIVEGVDPSSDDTPTATATPEPTPTESAGVFGDGFGIVAALLALLGAVLLARRR